MVVRILEDYSLRQMGDDFMLVRFGNGSYDMSEVFTFNSTAAFLWNKLRENSPCESSKLAFWLVEEYGISPEAAEADAAVILQSWIDSNLVG